MKWPFLPRSPILISHLDFQLSCRPSHGFPLPAAAVDGGAPIRIPMAILMTIRPDSGKSVNLRIPYTYKIEEGTEKFSLRNDPLESARPASLQIFTALPACDRVVKISYILEILPALTFSFSSK
jgi:hypothetical protein